jgi:hypothetical protein
MEVFLRLQGSSRRIAMRSTPTRRQPVLVSRKGVDVGSQPTRRKTSGTAGT